MKSMIPIVIVGARGRMGTQLIREVVNSDDLALAGAVDRTGAPGMGEDAGKLLGLPEVGVRLTDTLRPTRGQVVVDFSLPEGTETNIARCLEAEASLVLGTTGFDSSTIDKLKEAGKTISIVSAANFSVGVTLLTKLAALAARALGPSWDAELFELHHKHKRDAPSGTALRIAKAVASATDRTLDANMLAGRAGNHGPRQDGEIGVAALRGGDSIGEHTLMLLGDGERIELSHRATDRAIFAIGALRAARWVAAQDPGLYDMADVLGLASLS